MTEVEAREVADASATRGGVEIRESTSMDTHTAISDLLQRIWGAGPDYAPLNPALIRVASHLGCYVTAAYEPDGGMVGASFGMFADDGHLHSHITGVDPSRQGRGIGLALKADQRVWSLEHGIDKVSWTFDPLVARNAYFNISHLGVDVVAYQREFYGEMHDEINAGDPSDRLFVEWNLRSPRAEEAMASGGSSVDLTDLHDTAVTLDVQDERPMTGEGPVDQPTIVIGLPREIETIRGRDQALAREWRLAVRTQLGDALKQGYRVTGVSRQGWYVLEKQ